MNMVGGMVEYFENNVRSFFIIFGWFSYIFDKIINIVLWFFFFMDLSFVDVFKLVEEGLLKKLILLK